MEKTGNRASNTCQTPRMLRLPRGAGGRDLSPHQLGPLALPLKLIVFLLILKTETGALHIHSKFSSTRPHPYDGLNKNGSHRLIYLNTYQGVAILEKNCKYRVVGLGVAWEGLSLTQK